MWCVSVCSVATSAASQAAILKGPPIKFKTSNKFDRPYARIEIQNVTEDMFGHSTGDLYVRFYTDDDCLFSYTLPNDVTIDNVKCEFESINQYCGGTGPCGDWTQTIYQAYANNYEVSLGNFPLDNQYGSINYSLDDFSSSSYFPLSTYFLP